MPSCARLPTARVLGFYPHARVAPQAHAREPLRTRLASLHAHTRSAPVHACQRPRTSPLSLPAPFCPAPCAHLPPPHVRLPTRTPARPRTPSTYRPACQLSSQPSHSPEAFACQSATQSSAARQHARQIHPAQSPHVPTPCSSPALLPFPAPRTPGRGSAHSCRPRSRATRPSLCLRPFAFCRSTDMHLWPSLRHYTSSDARPSTLPHSRLRPATPRPQLFRTRTLTAPDRCTYSRSQPRTHHLMRMLRNLL